MARKVLSPDEVQSLVRILRNLFAHQVALRKIEPLSTSIQLPKIPPVLSESIAYHLFAGGVLSGGPLTVRQSTSGGDLEFALKNGGWAKVEIKATADSAFQALSRKDLDATFLVWMHFGSCFVDPATQTFAVYILDNPRRLFPEPRKITLQAFLAVAGTEALVVERRIDDPFARLDRKTEKTNL